MTRRKLIAALTALPVCTMAAPEPSSYPSIMERAKADFGLPFQPFSVITATSEQAARRSQDGTLWASHEPVGFHCYGHGGRYAFYDLKTEKLEVI